jgi:hypothetical protein
VRVKKRRILPLSLALSLEGRGDWGAAGLGRDGGNLLAR